MTVNWPFCKPHHACVFFAQHIVEKRHNGLWEGPLFIA